MIARNAFSLAFGLAVVFQPASAMAAIDDLQIDWVIPAGTIDETALHEGKERRVLIRPVPRKMFAPNADVISSDGVKLLPAGAPLYAMVGPAFMVCSQAVAPAAYVAKSNRVCLRDADGDGKLDTYFTRSRGRSFMAGDQMWFAMNNNIPKPLGSIQSIELAEVDRVQAPERPGLDIGFSAQRNGTVRMTVVIEGQHSFSMRCEPTSRTSADDDHSTFLCMDPGFEVLSMSVGTADKPAYDLKVVAPKREVAVRFDVAPRLMGARLMNGMYFE